MLTSDSRSPWRMAPFIAIEVPLKAVRAIAHANRVIIARRRKILNNDCILELRIDCLALMRALSVSDDTTFVVEYVCVVPAYATVACSRKKTKSRSMSEMQSQRARGVS